MTKPDELYACIYAREFPVQTLLRLRRELGNGPCTVMEGEPPLEQVCSLNTKARKLGIAHGMTRVEIETFPPVTVLSRSLSEETATRAALLECAGAFSPRVEERSAGNVFLCVIDISGTEKLFGSPPVLGMRIFECVQALGITASVAISRNFHASVCYVRGMSAAKPVTVIPPGQEVTMLGPLPLTVLNISSEQAETFSLWGIRTVGMLEALPEKALIARIGQEGKRLRLLARGELPHLFVPVEPELLLEERLEFDSPIEQLDSLLFAVNTMLDQLILRAVAHALALASVTLAFQLDGDASHKRIVSTSIPTNDRPLWLKLIQLDLEAHPAPAAILALILTAEPRKTSKIQLGLFSPQLPEPMRLDVTLARIRAIVGEGCVGRPVLTDTHQPDSFHMEPFSTPPDTVHEVPITPLHPAQRQLRPPESVWVTLREKKPETFVFRGKEYEVEDAYGPWLTGGDWWSPTPWGIHQWDLIARSEDNALLYCCMVFDVTRNCWQVVALYD